MTNIRNLGSKERLGVQFKDEKCAELCLKLCFERDWYFCNVNDPGWFSQHPTLFAMDERYSAMSMLPTPEKF